MANDKVSSVLLLLLIFYSQLTYSASIVKFLPGFDGPLPFELETGYIGVGEEEEVQLFYYFIKSERNPKEDPLLLWLSGGPGCSSISGLLYENGPMKVKHETYNGTLPSLVSTTYSWTKISSIIYLDQPVGTGFSYSRTKLVNKPRFFPRLPKPYFHLDNHMPMSLSGKGCVRIWVYHLTPMMLLKT